MNLQLIIIFAKFCILKIILVMIIANRGSHEPFGSERIVKQEQELDLLVKINAFGGFCSRSSFHILKKRELESGSKSDELYRYKVARKDDLVPGKEELAMDDNLRVGTTSTPTTTAVNANDSLAGLKMNPDFVITFNNDGFMTITSDYLDGRGANVTAVSNRTMSPAPMSADITFSRGYCIGTYHQQPMLNWLCKGSRMEKVPIGLPNVISLSALVIYNETLRDFSMEHSPSLRHIEPGAFNEMRKLRVIYILDAPQLTSFDQALNGSYPDLQIIRIELTGLQTWPNMELFSRDKTFTSMDLDFNEIRDLGEDPLDISTESLNLDHNQIRYIHEHTFSGSEIGELSFKGNRQLEAIHERAFANIQNLIKLDLSDTAIRVLPTAGLDDLRFLILMGTHQLLKMPSIYGFPKLETALLHYSYHCCSFRYHKLHDPSAYREFQLLQNKTNRLCPPENPEAMPRGLSSVAYHPSNASVITTHLPQPKDSPASDFEGIFSDQGPLGESELAAAGVHSSSSSKNKPIGDTDHSIPDWLDKAIEDMVPTSVATRKLLNRIHAGNVECGELAQLATVPNVTCTPRPDAFNPCEDIMGYPILRVAVWFVAGASLLGNLSVIIVLASVFQRLSVPKFLQLNLAIGDLFMGVYLAMLALADITTVGSYFNYALGWQQGFGCKIAGAASLFASQLSIYTLTVITFERYYTITYSIDLNMRLQLGPATRIMLAGWLFAFISAMLPIFADVSSYSKTSICLPLRTSSFQDQVFLALLLLVDSGAFVIIFACYLRMYRLIVGQKTQANMKEKTIAARMALLVFTDFACWFPIIFFGATALWGSPLISVTDSKILIVFFYPLNSMANPFLYVISTRQYRRDLTYLASRWHTWRRNLFRFGSQLDSPSYYNQAQLHVMMNQAPATAICLANAAAQSGPGQSLRPAHLNRQLRLEHQQQQQHRNNQHQKVLVCSEVSHQSGRYLIGHEVQPVASTELIEMASTLVHLPESMAATGSGGTCTQPSRLEPLGEVKPRLPPELPRSTEQSRHRAVCCCCPRQASMSPGQTDLSRATQEQRLTMKESTTNSAKGAQEAPQANKGSTSSSSRAQLTTSGSGAVVVAKTNVKTTSKKDKKKRRCSCLAVDDIFVDSLREFQYQLNLPQPAPCPKHHKPLRANTIAVDPREALLERERHLVRHKEVDILGNLTHICHNDDNNKYYYNNEPIDQACRCKSCGRQLFGGDQRSSSSTRCRRHPHTHHHHRHHHHHEQQLTIDGSTSGNQTPNSTGCSDHQHHCHQHRSHCRRLHQLGPLPTSTSAEDEQGQQQQRAPSIADGNRLGRTHHKEKCCPSLSPMPEAFNQPGVRQLNGPPAVVIQMGPNQDDSELMIAKGASAPDSANNSQSNDLKLSSHRVEHTNQHRRQHRGHHHHHRRHLYHHHHGSRNTRKHRYHETCLVETLTEKQQEASDNRRQPDAISRMVVLVKPPEPTNTGARSGSGVSINRVLTPILKRQSTLPKESENKLLKLVRTGSLQLPTRRTRKKRVSIVTREVEVINPPSTNKI